MEISLKSQDLAEIPESVLRPNVEKLFVDFNEIKVLDAHLFQTLTSLVVLSLNGNNLQLLPSEIFCLENLEELYVKENSLKKLPVGFGETTSLKKFHLTGNELTTLPENFCSLNKLEELVANENKIKQLPVHFGSLCQLKHLDLSCNDLESLPDSFGDLISLSELNLSNNSLISLPLTFQCLPSLEIIDLSYNKIISLPEYQASSSNIKKFLMMRNHLSSLPAWISEMDCVQELSFSENDIQGAPLLESFGAKNIHLQLLDISGNNISSLPGSFGKLKKLTSFDIGSPEDELERNRFLSNGNCLTLLPPSFINLLNLSKLQLDENEISELPEQFGLLENLTYLDLGHNVLHYLPDSFCNLKRLKICLLSMNDICLLPSSLGMLSSLEELKLDNNVIEELPDSFQNLTQLISLDLYRNRLTELPKFMDKLKSLKHLDIRENKFGIEVQNIRQEATYTVRDPELQNNWRGRKRQDIPESFWVEKRETDVCKVNVDDDIIYTAIASGSSLWRKHGQTSMRNSQVMKSQDTLSNQIENLNNSLSDDFNTNECGDPEYDLKTSQQFDLVCNTTTENEQEECWDNEIQADKSASSSLSSFETYYTKEMFEHSDWDTDPDTEIPCNFKKVYHHPVEIYTKDLYVPFIPSDLHVPKINASEVWCPIEEGQFDDDED